MSVNTPKFKSFGHLVFCVKFVKEYENIKILGDNWVRKKVMVQLVKVSKIEIFKGKMGKISDFFSFFNIVKKLRVKILL